MIRLPLRCLVFWSGSIVVSWAGASTPDFDREVRPILAEHCLECHSLDKAKGGLALTTREAALKILKSGHAGLVPGKPELSEVVKRVATLKGEERMPPEDRKSLTTQEIETLRAWVLAGADWPVHWAYRSIQKPAVPPVTDAAWPKGDLDRFVLATLEKSNIKPSPESDRVTLIRRVYYDLLGLPPAPKAVADFVNDPSAGAYERMVDGALASKHFGERWGRHWLDMARYADSDGYEKDRPRPDAWRYRDWVIDAVNTDLPFDQFTVEQLAGDLLPNATSEQILATAFHRQTLTNTEGGADQEQFRVEAVFDRTETTGSVWLGLSVGCARCHSHKYDQISHDEYFRLFAFFNNGDEVSRQVATSPKAWAEYEQNHGKDAALLTHLQKKADEARAAVKGKIPLWEPQIQERLAQARKNKASARFEVLPVTSVKSRAGTTFKKLDDGSWLAAGEQKSPEEYTLVIEKWDQQIVALQIEVLPDESLPGNGPGRNPKGNFVLSEIVVSKGTALENARVISLHSPKADFEQKGYTAQNAVDGNKETGWAIQPQFGVTHTLTLQLEESLTPEPGQMLFVRLDQAHAKGKHNLGRFRLLASPVVTEESVASPEVVKVLNEEPLRRNDVVIKPLLDWIEKRDPEAAAATQALEEARKRLPKPPLMDVRVVAQRTKDPRPTRRLHRGDFLSPTEEVKPGALDVLPKLMPRSSQVSDRLDLARWLVSPENPLTPRVTVNHVWARLFGEGLVRTVNDFGVRGERPTHPELLDWLAVDFMNHGWSRKQLIKSILMSATYRQSSVHRPELSDVDPQNRLLHRQNRLRVEGEIVRDLYLSAGGLLSDKTGGPSVFPPIPPDIAELSYANNFKWATSSGADRYRRGMYTFFKRTAPHPDLVTFDCPDANTTSVKRTVSNTPLQALTTLNAGAFADAAKGLAARVMIDAEAGAGTGDSSRVSQMYKICLARSPSEKEMRTVVQLLDSSRAYYASHPEDAAKFVKGFEVPKIEVRELAAWTAVARIVLNLDEFITRD
ncbi:MAG TPA: PSD1 and planctomycete cytochrome C domain-containing protein [Verrucomicrobium sp.]|nr:PSD1 and planctomycete cytochrome C domain-containing protein [Verrucomicrobium sp.]